MLGNYSKFLGSIVGGIFGILVGNFGLPTEYATPEIQNVVTVIMSALFTYAFPANQS